jgi:hypothetical protein
MFELEKGTSKLEGTCYFEFVKDSDKKKECWNEEAYYLTDEIFDFIYPLFKRAIERFDYYAFNKLNQSEIKRLLDELSKFEKNLNQIKKEEEFKGFFEKIYFWIEKDEKGRCWKDYIEIFKITSETIRKLGEDCLEGKQILWVLGL